MFTIDENIYESIDELLDVNIQFIKSNKKIEYANVPCVIDIETSSFYNEKNEKRGIMYAFVIGINGKCYIGRTYDDLWSSIDKIVKFYNINLKRRMIFYIHNLSYEFQWFRKWRTWEKVFATDDRCPLYALDSTGIEFRCSYLLSGYSLKNVAKNLTKYKTQKMVGDLDYKTIRHSETPLTKKEYGYILHDGLVVMAYIQEEIENHRDNITFLPLTKTGKVRTHIRKLCLYAGKHHNNTWKFKNYHNMMKAIPIVSIQEYEQLKRAFHGGFTHANSLMVNKIYHDVYSYDFTSSYPAVLVTEKFPMGKGELITIHNRKEFEKNLKLYCCLFDCYFENIESAIIYEHPISTSKCYKLSNYTSDNGRLVSADMCCITLTEQDFAVIRKFYKWDKMKIKNFRRYRKQYLPHDFIRGVLDLYQKKTELKGIKEFIVEYMNSKEMLNSCFGMCVTDICRTEIDYMNDTWGKLEPNMEEDIKKYNEKKNRFLCYQWGVWVTAYAMRNLFTAIVELKEDYIYSDTDSVKFLHLEKHLKYFEEYNKNMDEKLNCAKNFHGFEISRVKPKTKDGKIKPLGYWDYETCYKSFKTLGAKRYMIESYEPIKYGTDENPVYYNYSLTVSGVNKEYAIPYLYEKYHDDILNKFDDGLLIPPQHTGKNIHTYIDEETSGYVVDYLGKKLSYYEKSSIHLEESSYELSLSRDFIDYLLGIRLTID